MRRGTEKEDKSADLSSDELAERFKKIMLSRISDDSEKADAAEDEKADKEEATAGGPEAEGKGTKPRSRFETKPKTGRAYYEKIHKPQLLKRPVILCVDTGGDCYPLRPKPTKVGESMRVDIQSYAYLTWRSRTTKELPRNTGVREEDLLPLPEQSVHGNWHGFFLQSAYALGFGHEPEFTNYYVTRWNTPYTRTKNFIMFTPQNFRVINLLDAHSREWIQSQETAALPCANYPSDHILVGCDFEVATFKAIPAIEKPREHPAKYTEATAPRYYPPAPTGMRPLSQMPPGGFPGHPAMMAMGRGGVPPFGMPTGGPPMPMRGTMHAPRAGVPPAGRMMMPGMIPPTMARGGAFPGTGAVPGAGGMRAPMTMPPR